MRSKRHRMKEQTGDVIQKMHAPLGHRPRNVNNWHLGTVDASIRRLVLLAQQAKKDETLKI